MEKKKTSVIFVNAYLKNLMIGDYFRNLTEVGVTALKVKIINEN